MSKMVLDQIKRQLKDLTGDELDQLADETVDALTKGGCETCQG